MAKRLLILGVWLALCGVSGCSVQMAYNNLDRLARWSVNDYVDLTREQRLWFDQEFLELWNWHRREHLPEYARVLEQAADRLDEGLDAVFAEAVAGRVEGWLDELQAEALPMAAELLASLSDAQVAHLAEALERSNRELEERERDADTATAQSRWRDELADRFRRLSGRLTPLQRAYLDQQAGRYRPELVLWADYRRRWQREFLLRLEQRADVAALQRDLVRLTAQRERYYGAELATVHAHNERLALEVNLWLIDSLSERQRARFRDRLVQLADDLRALAAAGPRGSGERPLCLVRCPDGGD